MDCNVVNPLNIAFAWFRVGRQGHGSAMMHDLVLVCGLIGLEIATSQVVQGFTAWLVVHEPGPSADAALYCLLGGVIDFFGSFLTGTC